MLSNVVKLRVFIKILTNNVKLWKISSIICMPPYNCELSDHKGEKPMATSLLPSIFVPLVGLVFPAVTMAALFLYIEQEQVT